MNRLQANQNVVLNTVIDSGSRFQLFKDKTVSEEVATYISLYGENRRQTSHEVIWGSQAKTTASFEYLKPLSEKIIYSDNVQSEDQITIARIR